MEQRPDDKLKTSTISDLPKMGPRPVRFSSYGMPLIFVLGILFIASAIYVGFNYVKEDQILVHTVEVTNLTNGTATVTWQSSVPSKGIVFYGKDDNFVPFFPAFYKNVEFDDRDVEFKNLNEEESVKSSGLQARYTHHVTIEGLDPETKYYFRIGNGFFHAQGKPVNQNLRVTFTTPPVMNSIVTPDPIFGVVKDKDGKVVTDGVVKVNLLREDGKLSSTVSSALNEFGAFSVDVGNGRYLFSDQTSTGAKDEIFELEDIIKDNLTVLYGPPFKATVVEAAPDLDQPTAEITLE